MEEGQSNHLLQKDFKTLKSIRMWEESKKQNTVNETNYITNE